MILSILAIVGEVLKFFFKWMTEWMDRNSERRKLKKEVRENEIEKAETQRSLLFAISKYNNI